MHKIKRRKWYMRRQCNSLLQCELRKLRLHIPRQRDRFQVPDGPLVEDCYPWWLEEEAPTWQTNTALYKIQLDQDSAVVQKGTSRLVQFSKVITWLQLQRWLIGQLRPHHFFRPMKIATCRRSFPRFSCTWKSDWFIAVYAYCRWSEWKLLQMLFEKGVKSNPLLDVQEKNKRTLEKSMFLRCLRNVWGTSTVFLAGIGIVE